MDAHVRVDEFQGCVVKTEEPGCSGHVDVAHSIAKALNPNEQIEANTKADAGLVDAEPVTEHAMHAELWSVCGEHERSLFDELDSEFFF